MSMPARRKWTEDVDDCVARVARHFGVSVSEMLDDYHRHVNRGLGAIIGSVHMFGCVRASRERVVQGQVRIPAPGSEASEETDPLQGFGAASSTSRRDAVASGTQVSPSSCTP